MEGLFKNKYRIQSARLKNYDYSQDGYYFVTICTKNRECLFGKIVDGKMVLNKFGKIVDTEWKRTESIRKNVILDEWITMPNHLHGIIIIENNAVETQGIVETHCDVSQKETQCDDVETHCDVSQKETQCDDVETHCDVSLQDDEYKNKFGPQKNNLSSIIRGFKSSVTKKINKIRNTPNLPVWQPKFYDHVIRNEKSLNEIGKYIIDNPDKWERDRNNPAKLYM